ncbi:hypothetical protein [Salipaludibacillus sp. CF4.18]|uniref:hypothetical protein n=1 Tax=Salipaludibacillus sp. CF4.18 TaxID=3373081 RepID=UPI003EE48512
MRNLKNTDLFKVTRIVRKTGFKKRMLEMDVPKDEKGNLLVTDNEYWIMLIMEVVEGIPDAEKELFKFLADVAGVKQEELENDEFEILAELIEHFKGQEKFTNFLKLAFNSAK